MSDDVVNVVNVYEAQLASIKAQYDEAAKKMVSAFEPLFMSFFDRNPEVQAIGWTQYTPGFNDGDPCTFSVHDVDVLVQTSEEILAAYRDSDEYEEDEIDWNHINLEELYGAVGEWEYVDSVYRCKHWRLEDQIKWKQEHPETCARAEELDTEIERMKNVLRKFPDEVYQTAFGDGSKIIVTRNGIEVNEYDCGY